MLQQNASVDPYVIRRLQKEGGKGCSSPSGRVIFSYSLTAYGVVLKVPVVENLEPQRQVFPELRFSTKAYLLQVFMCPA